MVTMVLSPREIFYAATIGVSRRVFHIKGGSIGKYGADMVTNGWQLDIEGSLAEMAVAKYLNLFWDGGKLGQFDEKDVGPYQVRATSRPDGCLIAHPDDCDDDFFVLVLLHDFPSVHLAGWIVGIEAKMKEYWWEGKNNRPAFFVPQKALAPMDLFKKTCVKA